MPKINIDPAKVKYLAGIGLSEAEIANALDCSVDTLQKRFRKAIDSGWLTMKSSLKRAQYDLAVNKLHPGMLQWLGKNYLGQSEEGNRKQAAGMGDQLEAFYKAIMAGPAKGANGDVTPEPKASPDVTSDGDKGPDDAGQ